MPMMQSHEFAEKLKQTAEFLLSRPDVPLGTQYNDPKVWVTYSADKESFLSAVRGLKPGVKEISDNYVSFFPSSIPLKFDMYINRDAVCRKVQDVKWECEPLLLPEEEGQLEVTESSDVLF